MTPTPSPSEKSVTTATPDFDAFISTVKTRLKRSTHAVAPSGRVFAYLRYSTNQQDPDSLDRQRDNVREYCRRQGLAAPEIFADPATSGTTISRPQLDLMIAECRNTPGSIVVVEEMSRLGRSNEAHYSIQLELLKCHTQFHAVRSGPMDEITRSILSTLAVISMRNDVTRLRDGKVQKMLTGKRMGAAPFGYVLNQNGNLDFHPDYAPVVRYIFDECKHGVSHRNIAIQLTKMGIPTRRAAHNWKGVHAPYWKSGQVGNIIRSPIYCGVSLSVKPLFSWEELTDREFITIKTPDKAIVDIETWRACQSVRISESEKETGGWGILTANVPCPACGSHMRTHTSNLKLILQCRTFLEQKGCNFEEGLHLETFERLVFDGMADLLQSLKSDEEYRQEVETTLDNEYVERKAKRDGLSARIDQKSAELKQVITNRAALPGGFDSYLLTDIAGRQAVLDGLIAERNLIPSAKEGLIDNERIDELQVALETARAAIPFRPLGGPGKALLLDLRELIGSVTVNERRPDHFDVKVVYRLATKSRETSVTAERTFNDVPLGNRLVRDTERVQIINDFLDSGTFSLTESEIDQMPASPWCRAFMDLEAEVAMKNRILVAASHGSYTLSHVTAAVGASDELQGQLNTYRRTSDFKEFIEFMKAQRGDEVDFERPGMAPSHIDATSYLRAIDHPILKLKYVQSLAGDIPREEWAHIEARLEQEGLTPNYRDQDGLYKLINGIFFILRNNLRWEDWDKGRYAPLPTQRQRRKKLTEQGTMGVIILILLHREGFTNYTHSHQIEPLSIYLEARHRYKYRQNRKGRYAIEIAPRA